MFKITALNYSFTRFLFSRSSNHTSFHTAAEAFLFYSIHPGGCMYVYNQRIYDPEWVHGHHDRKSTTTGSSSMSYKRRLEADWLQKNKICLLEWPNQNPDLNPIEMLWNDLQRSIRTRRPKNKTEPKQFWA